jgi:hypothetical protein
VKSEIVFEPKARVTFTAAEIKVLMVASEQHYDGKCKAAGNIGGEIYGMSIEAEWLQDKPRQSETVTVTRVMTFRQLDLLAKVTEYFGTTGVHGDPVLRDLHWNLNRLLSALNKSRAVDLNWLLDYLTANVYDTGHGLLPGSPWAVDAEPMLDALAQRLEISKERLGILFDEARRRVHGTETKAGWKSVENRKRMKVEDDGHDN